MIYRRDTQYFVGTEEFRNGTTSIKASTLISIAGKRRALLLWSRGLYHSSTIRLGTLVSEVLIILWDRFNGDPADRTRAAWVRSGQKSDSAAIWGRKTPHRERLVHLKIQWYGRANHSVLHDASPTGPVGYLLFQISIDLTFA